MPTRLAPFDLGVVAFYLVGITLFGLRFSRGKKQGGTLRRYFLADNTIPWWAIALSIVSAETSTLTIVSIPGVAFAGNFGFLQVVLGYMVGRVVVAALFLPRYFRGEMLTAYQLIDRRFGPALHKLTAGLFLLTRAAAEGVRVFAISIVVGLAIGTGDTLSIAIISGLTLLYTFEGGMAAVIWTDVVQMGLYVAGTVLALLTLGTRVPGNWTHIVAVGQATGKFHMLNFAMNLTTTYTFWAGVLGGTFLTMASHGTDQLMVQRMLAARSLRESRLALLSSGAVIFLQFTLFLLIGVGLYVFYGNHPATFRTNDFIFPTFIVREMPHGVAGLLVAAILAAAMSNLSAALNSLASTSVVDFYMHVRPGAANGERTAVSRVATVFWAVVLFAIAVYAIEHGGRGHVVETGLSIASVAYGCLLGVFLLGTLTRFATQAGAVVGMVCGLALNLALWLQPHAVSFAFPASLVPGQGSAGFTVPKVAFTWYVLIGAVATFAVGCLFSLIFRKQSVRRAGVAMVVLLLSAGAARAQAGGGTYDFSAVSALVTQAIAGHKLPGAVVVVGHDGRIVFEQAYGSRKLAGEPGLDGKASGAEPMTAETVFDMASLTKVLVTTTAVLQMYEQHKVELDAPVARYLPGFGQNGKDRITVRELLTHYSGLPEDVSLKEDWGLKAPDKAEGIGRAMASVPYGPAGQTFKYSDINFITLGALVEAVSGESLEGYAEQHIFGPLQMTQTRYLPYAKACGEIQHLGAATLYSALPEGEACARHETWSGLWIANAAPTAHDEEGDAATNPDFDHLLRGTVHDPTTRRMGGVAGHAGVFSTAGDMSRFCQAMLNKLLRNAGPFPLLQATLRLATTPAQPASGLPNATSFLADGSVSKGVALRGLGWDINSGFSRPRGTVFRTAEPGQAIDRAHPPSFGHTGFTGTSVWIDPASDSYVILLANAIHPRVGAAISGLRGEVATAAARALGVSAGMGRAPAAERTRTGIDVLEESGFAALKRLAEAHGNRLRLGLLTNQSGLDGDGRRTVDVLLHDAARAVPGVELRTLFSPEHGLYGRQDTEHLSAEVDATTQLPVISLYGPMAADKHPRAADLAGLDAVVIDLQDIGARFWTYETLVGYFLETAASTGTEIVLLDRPNPIGGVAVQGPVSDVTENVYTNYMPLPVRHGLTLGELARYFNAHLQGRGAVPATVQAAVQATPHPTIHATHTAPMELNGTTGEVTGDAPQAQAGAKARLTVVGMENWRRDAFFGDTHLAWVPPSPNMRTPGTAVLYPGVALVEQTNLSVGRGTATPYERIGAPWMEGARVASYLESRHIPGVRVTATTFRVAEDGNRYPSHGQTIPGIHLEVTDRVALDSPEFGVELLSALHHLYPVEFQLAKARMLVGHAPTLAAIAAGDDPRAIAARWTGAVAAFRQRSAAYLLYP